MTARDASWLRKDWVVIGVLFTLLTVLNVVTVITSRDAQRSADRTATIVKNQNLNRAFLSELMETTGNCTLLASAAVNTEEIPFTPEAISDYYGQCVKDRSPELEGMLDG